MSTNYQHNLRFVKGKLQELVHSVHRTDEGDDCCSKDIWVDVPEMDEQDSGYITKD